MSASSSELGRGEKEMSRIAASCDAARRAGAICLAVLLLWVAPFGAVTAQVAERSASSGEEAAPAPAKVHELLILLADPKVQQWLVKQGAAKADSGTVQKDEEFSVAHYFGSRLAEIHEHILTLGAAFPDLPRQFKQGTDRVGVDLGGTGRAKALLLLILFVALGFGVEWLFRGATRRIRERLEHHPLDTVNNRLRVVGMRFLFGVGLWRPSLSAASVRFLRSIGRRCFARSSSLTSSSFLPFGWRWWLAIFSYRPIRWPLGSGPAD
jgi:hypothetical protein